jgi:hypothetical protein
MIKVLQLVAVNRPVVAVALAGLHGLTAGEEGVALPAILRGAQIFKRFLHLALRQPVILAVIEVVGVLGIDIEGVGIGGCSPAAGEAGATEAGVYT